MFGAQVACQQTFIALGNAKVSVFLALLRKVFLLIDQESRHRDGPP